MRLDNIREATNTGVLTSVASDRNSSPAERLEALQQPHRKTVDRSRKPFHTVHMDNLESYISCEALDIHIHMQEQTS